LVLDLFSKIKSFRMVWPSSVVRWERSTWKVACNLYFPTRNCVSFHARSASNPCIFRACRAHAVFVGPRFEPLTLQVNLFTGPRFDFRAWLPVSGQWNQWPMSRIGINLLPSLTNCNHNLYKFCIYIGQMSITVLKEV
jgi:hypothetical protein